MTSGHSQGSKDSKAIFENYIATSGLWSPGGTVVEHDCATHVNHEMYGRGECLKEQHHLDESGNVDWYTVQFEHGIEQVPTSNLEILQFEKHEHGPMKKTRVMDEDAEEGNEEKDGKAKVGLKDGHNHKRKSGG
jgi:hypothetical protein